MIKCFASENSYWIDPQGHVRPCARFKEKFSHITEFVKFSDITSSKEYFQLRESLKNDVFHNGCIRCKEDEERGLKSKRQFYERTGLESPDDFMIDISMGNFCNLKCRMCGPHNSTLWISDYKSLVKEGIAETYPFDYKAYQLSDDDINKLIEHIASIKGNIYIEFKGGEPLIMPETKSIIDQISMLDNAKNISILIVTNGTVVPEWVDTVQQKIKKLFLTVSIDGIGEVYNYIRGTNKFSFDDCLENILTFKSMSNIDLRFNVVIQNLNIHQALEMHTVLMGINDKPINYITLSMPSYLAPNVMSTGARKTIYESFVKNSSQFGSYEGQMTNIHKLLLTEPDPLMYETFRKTTMALDRLRNQKLEDVLPHLM